MTIILVVEKLRQEDYIFEASLGTHGETLSQRK